MNFTEYYFTEKKKKKKKKKKQPDVNVFPKKKFNQASFFNPKKYDKGVHGTFDFVPGMVGEKFETKPDKVKWRKNMMDYSATFDVDNQSFEFFADCVGSNSYSISFNKIKKHGFGTNSVDPVKNVMKVFSAVLCLLKEFIETEDPKHFSFSADKERPSRVRLYNTFAKKVEEFLPSYDLVKIDKDDLYEPHDVFYYFQKKGLTNGR